MSFSTCSKLCFRFLYLIPTSLLFLLSSIPILLSLAQIRIHSPQSLAKETYFNRVSTRPGYIQGSTSTFGAPYYGLRVIGRIQYAPSKGQDYCTEDDYELPNEKNSGGEDSSTDHYSSEDHSSNSESSSSNSESDSHDHDHDRREINIVMIKRGESKCRFTTKVKVAEKHKNAHAVIIVDREKNSEKDVSKLIMSDEHGFGSNIKIPSILINWHDGKKIMDSLETGPVIVELAWDIPVDNQVSMDLWMSATSREAVDFMIGFKRTMEVLGYHAITPTSTSTASTTDSATPLGPPLKVIPHYHIFSLPAGQDFERMCTDASGKYCSEDPDSGGPVSGRDVAIESARQLCIYELASSTSGKFGRSTVQDYWDYVTNYLNSCPLTGPEDGSGDPDQRFGSEVCSNKVIEKYCINSIDSSTGNYYITPSKVKECLSSTMEDKLKQQKSNLAWSKYAVRLNGWRYSGSIEPDGITRAICSAFRTPLEECRPGGPLLTPHGKLPHAAGIDSNGNLIGSDGIPLNESGFGSYSITGFSFSGFLFLSAVLIALVFLGLVVYKKFFFQRYIQRALREEVMLEVQTQLADYVPLEERSGR